MSYSRSLDEYTDAELVEELARRIKARIKGLCDYCGRAATEQQCKFPSRHSKPLLEAASQKSGRKGG